MGAVRVTFIKWIHEIYTMNADGSGVTQLTSNGDDDKAPTWSPDGTKIAFGSIRDGKPAVYVMKADGTARINFHKTTKGYGIAPSWGLGVRAPRCLLSGSPPVSTDYRSVEPVSKASYPKTGSNQAKGPYTGRSLCRLPVVV